MKTTNQPVFLPMIVLAATAAFGNAATVVNLGSAADFTILAKTGITNDGATTEVKGDIGVSPISSAAITGFDLVLDSSGVFATSALVTGRVYASNYAEPTPTRLGVAVLAMEAAYTDAATRANPDSLNLAGGSLNGQVLAPGTYKWNSSVTITDSITLSGGGDSNAVWIFQIDNGLTLQTGASILLSGSAQAKNVFWQVAEGVDFLAGSHYEGMVLSKTHIALENAAGGNGNLYAQTNVTLIGNSINFIPEPSSFALVALGALAFVSGRRRKD